MGHHKEVKYYIPHTIPYFESNHHTYIVPNIFYTIWNLISQKPVMRFNVVGFLLKLIDLLLITLGRKSSWWEHIFFNNNNSAYEIIASAIMTENKKYNTQRKKQRDKKILHKRPDKCYKECERPSRIYKDSFFWTAFDCNNGWSSHNTQPKESLTWSSTPGSANTTT